ncbi:MAG TPA: hypothetical protein VFL93_04310 [Longimicrobiaceae bacterium]|nr:hypothetical protein [Longimicrobiaceae bacterium]
MRNTSRSLQRQVDLTTAVCQERLLATHVRHVIALVDLVSDRLPFDDALDIYVRVMRLTPEQARNIGSRALAELGRRGAAPVRSELPGAPAEPEPEEEHAEGRGRSDALFSRLRRRVRGRVQDELRERIDLSAARTEDDLLETHVLNGLVFAKALTEEVSAPEAIELYLETMSLPEGVADVIYNRALRRIADRVLPPLPEAEDDHAIVADAAASVAPAAE